MKKLIFSNYRKVLSKKLTRGRSIVKILAATVYLTAKQHKIPIFFDDICTAFEISKKTLNRSIGVIQIHLNFKIKCKLKCACHADCLLKYSTIFRDPSCFSNLFFIR